MYFEIENPIASGVDVFGSFYATFLVLTNGGGSALRYLAIVYLSAEIIIIIIIDNRGLNARWCCLLYTSPSPRD